MSHAIVNLDKVTHNAAVLESVVHTADMDQGSVVMLGDFVSGSSSVRQVQIPLTATLGTTELLFIKNDEVQGALYLPFNTLQDFYIAAGTYGKAYHMQVGWEFSITTDGFTGTAVVDQYLIPQNNSIQLAVAADLSGGTRFAARILQIGNLFGYTNASGGYAKKTMIKAQVVKV